MAEKNDAKKEKKKIVKPKKQAAKDEKRVIPLPEGKISKIKIPKIKVRPASKHPKAEEKEPLKDVSRLANDPYEILRFVVMTEKAVRMVELQNKLIFVVDRRFGKQQIKKAAQVAFDSEIEKVNTVNDQRGRKKAYIKFMKPGQAGDIAVRLGII